MVSCILVESKCLDCNFRLHRQLLLDALLLHRAWRELLVSRHVALEWRACAVLSHYTCIFHCISHICGGVVASRAHWWLVVSSNRTIANRCALTFSVCFFFSRNSNDFVQFLINCLVIGGFSYFTAFMEAATLDGFPYYQHTDRWLMYKYGSAFYALYFIVSFPMFLR